MLFLTEKRKAVGLVREILFRGKNQKGEWIVGFYVERNNKSWIYPNGNQIISRALARELRPLHSIKSTQKIMREIFPVIPETVGQYTGLTDKNGTKIFEGDIIRYADIYEYEIYLESLERPENFTNCVFDNMWTVDKVVYCIEHGYPAFDLNNHDFETNGLSELNESMQYHYEVIGNIHDNPELLKGGEG